MAQELTSVWVKRISLANQRYEEWKNKYRCDDLENYFRGFQWKLSRYETDHIPYTLNMVYSTVKIKLANYIVTNPRILVVPKPGDAAYNLEKAVASAQVKEALINTIIPDSNFPFVVKKAARDSFTRFGIIEVGYSANFLENPYVDKPEYASDKNPEVTRDRVITEPRETLESERIFFKHICPKRFRVGNIEGDTLESCNWVGYYDFVYIKDLAKALKKPWKELESELGTTAHIVEESEEYLAKSEGLTKIWHIWDNRARKRYIITDCDGEERFDADFDRLPLFDLRWDLDFDGFYPIPPTFQWISPQDEINEAREQARNHRRRFTRKYQALENSITTEELDKFNYGPDGTVVFTKRDNALLPIASPDLGKASDQGLVVPKDDFNLVSATSQEARGMGDRVTATQANIIENRSSIREGAEVEDINMWMAKIVKEAILLARDRFVHPMYAEMPKTSQSQMLQDYTAGKGYDVITPEMIDDGYDFAVLIDVASTSPNQNELEKRKYLEFIAVMNQFPQLSMSPILIRETAYRIGYRNEQVIKEMQNAALIQMIGMAAQNGALPGEGGTGQGNAPQQIVEQTTPPTSGEIENQIGNQLIQ